MSTEITITGNITADPQDVQTKTGAQMATFTVAETSRVRNSDGTFSDGNTTWYRVRCFNGLSRNVLASLSKGMRVTVQGSLEVVTREAEVNGESRTFTDAQVLANEIGVNLRFGKVTGFEKTQGRNAAPVNHEAEAAADAYLDEEPVGA